MPLGLAADGDAFCVRTRARMAGLHTRFFAARGVLEVETPM